MNDWVINSTFGNPEADAWPYWSLRSTDILDGRARAAFISKDGIPFFR
ncbi:hypothetical protein [Burkholderia stabilis]|nr:hypothetical protein [Burkholderia stabilis]